MSSSNTDYEQSELYRIRHSAAHVMAEAVLEFFPEAKLAIGPPIEDGFYYDFDLGKSADGKARTFTEEELTAIEEKFRSLLKQNAPFQASTKSVDEALQFFADEPYKIELIQDLVKNEGVTEVGIYQHRNFVDLCRGPHVGYTKMVKHNAVKILRTSGAYWRGDEKRPQLQRIYGTAFANKEELEQHLARLEEAKKRDHRRLGKQLELYHISPLVGAGLILWLPKGAILRDTLERFMRTTQLERGYLPVITPHIGNIELYKTSGHYPYYKASQFVPMQVDEEEYMLKPMNCPHHIEIYKSSQRSYRDLPYRVAEFGTVYRYEKSGELSGLTRVRGFTQDDAHLFVAPDQLEAEFIHVVELIQLVFQTMGMGDVRARLGTNDPASDKYAGTPEIWEKGINAIKNAADHIGLPYTVEEGEAAFYGPKLDFIVRDVLKRDWQLGTVQVDFVLPEKFELEYIGEDGQRHRPVMIHRAPFGSMERFIGILIEHFNGAFPLWLAPVQVAVIPIADRHVEYAQQVARELRAEGLRVELDDTKQRMNKKIFEAQMQKIPFMLVVGDQEAEQGLVAVRTRENEDRGTVPLAQFKAETMQKVTTRSLDL